MAARRRPSPTSDTHAERLARIEAAVDNMAETLPTMISASIERALKSYASTQDHERLEGVMRQIDQRLATLEAGAALARGAESVRAGVREKAHEWLMTVFPYVAAGAAFIVAMMRS